jgi:hypothetical protein
LIEDIYPQNLGVTLCVGTETVWQDIDLIRVSMGCTKFRHIVFVLLVIAGSPIALANPGTYSPFEATGMM